MLDFSVLIIRRSVAAKCWLCQFGNSNIIAPLPLTADASLDDALRHCLSRHPTSRVFHDNAGRLDEYRLERAS